MLIDVKLLTSFLHLTVDVAKWQMAEKLGMGQIVICYVTCQLELKSNVVVRMRRIDRP